MTREKFVEERARVDADHSVMLARIDAALIEAERRAKLNDDAAIRAALLASDEFAKGTDQ